DFTGDGQAEAIGGAADNGETEGRVHGINGADGSIEWTFVTEGTSVWALEQLNDVNATGTQDIIAGDFGGNIYIIDPENGAQLHTATAGNNLLIRFVKLDDVNNDGHPDILLAYSGTNGIVLSGLDASIIWFQSLADKAWVADRINDISGDGLNDAIIGTLFSDNYCYFLDGTTGEELESVAYYTPLDAIRAIPDIVGDHSMEMVAGGRNGNVFCFSGGINPATAIEELSENPGDIMASCYPNPFNSGSGYGTKINYIINEPGYTEVNIYDIQGHLVAKPDNGFKQKGLHVAEWNGQDYTGNILPAGLYFCRITSGRQAQTLKISML
ncbi:MAG: T9SS type A sorting domain-containing protein, partial [Bacteroidales bacterium]|nr:T9SS type A sorting domain-containing protein [Bacteroidales bacterium]